MNFGQFNYSLYNPCLPGGVVAFLSLAQEIVGSNTIFYKNILQILWMCTRLDDLP